jgi:predicted TIM-barrel fold metal-dependent hydrolase
MTSASAKRTFPRRTLLGTGVVGSATWLLRSRSRAASAAPLVVDIHAHNFNSSDLPVRGFTAHFIPFLTDVSHEVTPGPERLFRLIAGKVQDALNLVAPSAQQELAVLSGAGALPWPAPVAESGTREADTANRIADELAATTAWVVGSLGKKIDVKAVVRRAAQIVNLIARSRAAITATLADTYPGVGLFVPMLVDFDNWAQDKAPSLLADQIKAHGAVARKSIAAPLGPGRARVHPFVAFDPKRSDALDLVKTAVEQEGFIGVKVYPPVGFAPAENKCLLAGNAQATAIDAALNALYEYCTTNDVPITTHCSAGNEFGLGFRDLVAPFRWEPVLKKFKKVRLNLGHFGHTEGVDTKRGFRSCEAWIRQAAYLMDQYENVYADLSGSSFNDTDAGAAAYAKLIEQAFGRYTSVPKRLMYGSDWWLNRLSDGAPGYLDQFRTNFARLFPGNDGLQADVLGRNALRFLGFAREGGDRARNRDRLALVYEAASMPLPSWLGN